jgi:hypothetical protein
MLVHGEHTKEIRYFDSLQEVLPMICVQKHTQRMKDSRCGFWLDILDPNLEDLRTLETSSVHLLCSSLLLPLPPRFPFALSSSLLFLLLPPPPPFRCTDSVGVNSIWGAYTYDRGHQRDRS